MTGDKEKARLLRILLKENADLEWPSRNHDLRQLVLAGLVTRARNYVSAWGGRDHEMTTLKITDAGREWLTRHELR